MEELQMRKNNTGLTLTLIFDANSANYGESGGNISELKKVAHNGSVHTMISRQALGYNIRTQLGYPLAPVFLAGGKEKDEKETSAKAPDDEGRVEKKKGVVQFAPEATVKDFPEIDLFGYLKTSGSGDNKTMKRTAVARISDAISLSPFAQDMDFMTNMGLASRNNLPNNIANMEKHISYYAYTVSVDLADVGVDEGVSVISEDEKAERVCALLRTLEYLYRDIKGRRENLAPVFAIGGVYSTKNPLFMGRVKTTRNSLVVPMLTGILEDSEIAKNTVVGMSSGIFSNDAEVAEALSPTSVAACFESLRKAVKSFYAEA
jgi:CRISPR-associated protein Cst2